MGRFVSPAGVTISVDDSKDDRYGPESGFKPADEVGKAPAKKAAPSKSEK